ncbi:MAG: GTPase Era [Bacillota bacterium]|nr:GTPase Era [Bacillota bacterium]
MFVSGFVSVIGRPNVGKSTLINSLLGKKVLIVSDKPQTTRNRIQAILTTENAQVIFLDTPGLHKPKHKLGDYMVKSALGALKEVELILFMVEAFCPPGPGDTYIASLLQGVKAPVFLVMNKTDLAPQDYEEKFLPLYRKLYDFKGFFLISAREEQNLESLLNGITEVLPEGPQYYPSEMLVDHPEQFLAGEMIREKIFMKTREEIPHSVAVEVSSMELRKGKDLLDIQAVIYVEKDSQKKIIIGRNGSMLKEIGTEARHELERVFGNPVFLDLWVKVKKDWRKKENNLRQFGYE